MKKVWINVKNDILNISVGFRYVFKENREKVCIKLAAASTFRVFLNGEFLFAGPSRTAKKYSLIHNQEIQARAGDVLAVDVCNYRINAFFPAKEEGFFACELTANGERFADTDDFKGYLLSDRLEKTQRLNFQRSFTEAYDMQVCRKKHYLGEDVFAEIPFKEVDGNTLISAAYPPCSWQRVSAEKRIEYGDISYSDEENPLKARIYDVVDEKLSLGYPKAERDIHISDEILRMRFWAKDGGENTLCQNEYFLYEFSRNFTGLVSLNVEVEEDCEIYCLFDEVLWDEVYQHPQFTCLEKTTGKPLIFNRMHICNAVVYRLKKGGYELTFSEPYSIQFLKIACTKGKLRIMQTPQVILMQNEKPYAVDFSVADEKMQAVFDAGRHSLAQNTFDVPTDCPGRERAGYPCDSYFTTQAEWSLCGNNTSEENLFRVFLLEENCEFLPPSMFPMCAPADHNDHTYIPNWAMWFIVEVAEYGKRTDNLEWQNAFKDRFYRVMNFFRRYENEDGLLEDLENWVFVEWSKCNDFIDGVNYPTNMLYAKMLLCMAEMYGDETLKAKGLAVREKILGQSYDGYRFRDHAVRKDGKLCVCADGTETCQYYAFALDMISAEEYPALAKFMFDEITPYGKEVDLNGAPLYKANSFIGNYLRFLQLAKMGRYTQLLEEITEYSYPMAIRTATLWEHNKTDGSCNHGFTSIVNKWMLEACGYFGYNEKKNCVYIGKPSIAKDFCIKVPCGKGEVVLTQKDGEYSVCVSGGVERCSV